MLAADFRQRLKVAKLHGSRHRGQDRRSVDQRLRGLELGLGVNDLGPAVALGFGLFGDRLDHIVGELDVTDLDGAHLDAPVLGARIEDVLHVDVELGPLGQHLVEFVLSEHRAERGLGQHVGRSAVRLDLNDRFRSIDDVKVEHGVDLDRHVVPRNHVLTGDLHDHRAQVDAHDLLDDRYQEDEARSADAREAPQRELDAALVLTKHLERSVGDPKQEDDNDESGQDCG